MKKILILILCIALFLAIDGVFLAYLIIRGDIVFIAPALVFFFASCLFLYLLFKETVIGWNAFSIEDLKILVRRKGTLIASIEKEQIEDLVIIYDLLSEDEEAIRFSHRGKRYFIRLEKFENDAFREFIKDLPYSKKRNLWYYLLSLIAH